MMDWIVHTGVGTVTFFCASLLVCAVCFALTWRDYRNGWEISVQPIGSLFILLVISIVAAFNAHNPYAGKPQIAKTGVLIPKFQSIYHHRHWHGYGVLACVNNCDGDVPLLELNEEVSITWKKAGTNREYSVVHLAAKEPVDIGDYDISAHLVLAMSDSSTGESIYSVDTKQHWDRVALFGLSALISLATFIVCFRIGATDPHLQKDTDSGSADDPAMPDEITSLSLEPPSGE